MFALSDNVAQCMNTEHCIHMYEPWAMGWWKCTWNAPTTTQRRYRPSLIISHKCTIYSICWVLVDTSCTHDATTTSWLENYSSDLWRLPSTHTQTHDTMRWWKGHTDARQKIIWMFVCGINAELSCHLNNSHERSIRFSSCLPFVLISFMLLATQDA